MRSGDRFEYRALPSQLKSLLSQLEPHHLCDFPNAQIVRVYLQPLEFLQLQGSVDKEALALYAERSFGWQQSKLESVLHPVLWCMREWRERGLMGRGQMRERTDDANANAKSGAPLTQLSITEFATRVQTPCSTSKTAHSSRTN